MSTDLSNPFVVDILRILPISGIAFEPSPPALMPFEVAHYLLRNVGKPECHALWCGGRWAAKEW